MRIIVLCILFLAPLGTILYQVKTGIDKREERLFALEAEIDKSEREIAVLEAEWAYLSRPERVMELSDRLLGMRPISVNRVLAIDAIPMRPIPKFKNRTVDRGQMKPEVDDGIVTKFNLLSEISGPGVIPK